MSLTRRRRTAARPDSPAQAYALVAGIFLLALGILALIFETGTFGSVGAAADQPQFLIWRVSGWMTILWILMGGLGVLSAGRLASARIYALAAGAIFAVLAIWGFIDGDHVASIFVAGTVDNITHAVLAVLGLAAWAAPRERQRPVATDAEHDRSARIHREPADRSAAQVTERR
jgi:hypothetical protein